VICAVVPIKAFRGSKSRLAPRFDQDRRAALSRASAIRVLSAFTACQLVHHRIAVVEDEDTAALARNHHFEVLLRPDLWGQSAAVNAGFETGVQRGATTLVTISADVPLTRPRDIEDILRPAGPVLVMVTNREGEGTNALRVSPAQPMRLHFGPGSLEQHRREAAGLKLPVTVLDNPRLRLDIDTPDDLDALEKSGADGRQVLVEAGRFLRDLAVGDKWSARTQGA
jgi:2-phospho-L-lactate/phosphoenolpyruvate guanylyltransferase